MIIVNMHEAKTRLSELVKKVEEGNEVVVVCRDGQEVAEIRPDGPQVLLDYYASVHARSLEYVQRTTCSDMDRVIDRRWDPPVTVGVRLISVVNDCTQHAGQMAYVRGLVEGKRWLPY